MMMTDGMNWPRPSQLGTVYSHSARQKPVPTGFPTSAIQMFAETRVVGTKYSNAYVAQSLKVVLTNAPISNCISSVQQLHVGGVQKI